MKKIWILALIVAIILCASILLIIYANDSIKKDNISFGKQTNASKEKIIECAILLYNKKNSKE